ncbi:arsenic resistance protein [Lyngbya sp. PCC 8106]|uniref:arsenic resistance protein n=1 Tax=Lyngbya sp. (strain PCC 8106) TaxID=313612 RepID=UPI0000EAC636|nr:bile acid:sodium symporter [Lyngbya sp. PCC 8106]EAW38517.1 arsenical-resistance protein; possible sodium/bile acid symporter family [Lyngbya sp. PCC 8106]
MTWFDRTQPFLVLFSVVVGLMLAQVPGLSELAPNLIVPLLALMLYATFLPLSLNHFGEAFRNSKVALASVATNFLWTPVFAWGLGAIFLQDSPDLWVGLIMLMVTPCTDWYLVFTGIAGGDVALATALLPLNLILQVLLLPVYLLFFAGTLVELNPVKLFESVLWVLLIPLLFATVSRRLIRGWKGEIWFEQRLSNLTVFQILSLNLAIVAIFVSKGHTLIQRPELVLKLLIPVVLFFATNFILAHRIGRYFKFSYEEFACLICTTLARNSPLSLAIAAAAFPHRPLIAVTLVIGPLIELPIMVLISQILLQIRRREQW